MVFLVLGQIHLELRQSAINVTASGTFINAEVRSGGLHGQFLICVEFGETSMTASTMRSLSRFHGGSYVFHWRGNEQRACQGLPLKAAFVDRRHNPSSFLNLGEANSTIL